MEVKKKKFSGSVKVEPDVLEQARSVCKSKGLLLSAFVTSAVFREINRQKRLK